ncbi:hypothetical protein AHF37_07307 [Paragonimus kellicotti]|nr:hypothetical protein AHF37_07307 [Paragonimus kellicotti]
MCFYTFTFSAQVVILADSSLSGTLTVPGTPNHLLNPRQPIYTRVESRCVGLSHTRPNALFYFGIHPESQLYLSAFSAPPPKLLFIESLLQGDDKLEDTNGNSRLVYQIKKKKRKLPSCQQDLWVPTILWMSPPGSTGPWVSPVPPTAI